jgi:hypothetical protein
MQNFARFWVGCLVWSLGVGSAWAGVSVSAEFDAVIRPLSSDQTQNISAGKSFDWDAREPLVVEEFGRTPVVLIPTASSNGAIKLRSKALGGLGNVKKPDSELDLNVSEILMRVSGIQTAIEKHNIRAASNEYETLVTKFPKVPFLKFLGASLSLLNGQKSDARHLTEEGLRAHPDYEKGKRFLESLDK